MTRRQLLTAGVALAAAGAGFGLAAWRRSVPVPASSAFDAAPKALPTDASPIWTLEFDAARGAPIQLQAFFGQPLLVNFWATWCGPCVKEMPMLDAFARAQSAKGLRVLGLAVDSPTPVREFLLNQAIEFPNGLAGMDGVELSRKLGNSQGGLPFTVVFDAKGVLVDKKMGALTSEDLSGWAKRLVT
ncbi:MAG: hypothetical protein RLZZ618_1296 [Pseudomonadota bacterium]|jgi:thiol-disulfide isomerase/thioredoxin